MYFLLGLGSELMIDGLNQRLDELKELIEKNHIYKEAKLLREKLLKEGAILEQVFELKNTKNIYSSDYQIKKQKLFENKDYQRYQELENQLYFMILEINRVLNELTNRKGCQHEDY